MKGPPCLVSHSKYELGSVHVIVSCVLVCVLYSFYVLLVILTVYGGRFVLHVFSTSMAVISLAC